VAWNEARWQRWNGVAQMEEQSTGSGMKETEEGTEAVRVGGRLGESKCGREAWRSERGENAYRLGLSHVRRPPTMPRIPCLCTACPTSSVVVQRYACRCLGSGSEGYVYGRAWSGGVVAGNKAQRYSLSWR